MSITAAFIGNNSFQVDAAEAQAKISEKYPLLLHEKESVELAFTGRGGAGRDKSYLTTHRILIKDGKGIGGKRKNYLSIPYSAIKAFSISTAGKLLDGDVELRVWPQGMDQQTIRFAKSQVDIFEVQGFMNLKINFTHTTGTQDYVDTTPPPKAAKKDSATSSLMDWIGGNARQLDPAVMESHLKTEMPILVQDEKVEMAFKEKRDSVVFTNKRLLVIDVKGLSGKKIEFVSFTWRCISSFAVETAGAYFDRDTQMKIYTNIESYGTISQDFRSGRADVFAIQKYLSNRILGEDETTVPDVDQRQGHVDPKTGWWFRDDQRPLDAAEMDRYYTNEVPILQGSERVELAFKGRRDITLFTTKRLIDIDPKGWKGEKIEYTSVPWKSVFGFGVKSAGKHFDRDAEVRLWTDMMYIDGGDDPDSPGMSFLELDFNKDMVDIMVLKKYLSERLLGNTPKMPIPTSALQLSCKEKGFEKFLSKIGDDQRAIDPSELNRELHTTNPILLDGEDIVMAFKAGRDVTIFTNLRIMEMDVQGWSGEKISYTSIPYTSIRAFSAESAGGWDRDSEVDIYTRNRWTLKKFAMDFRKGKADIIVIQKFLSAIVLGNDEDKARYFTSGGVSPIERTNPAGLKSFLAWLTDNGAEADPKIVDAQLHSDPPILLSEERVNRAFKQGRDMYVYTTHRVIVVDVQGMRGKKVKYKSIPIEWCKCFEIETAGNMDRDAEVYIHTDVPGKAMIAQSILVKKFDIYEMHAYWTDVLLFGGGRAH